ncbi:energy transducer TonB [Sphingopyxis panaciterrae]
MKMGATLRRFGILPGLAACVAVPAPGMAEEPLRLAPSSQWNVNYADDSCRLARAFGTGDEEVILILDRFQPGPMVYMTLTGKPVKVNNDKSELTVRFGTDEPAQMGRFSMGKTENATPAVLLERALYVAGSPDDAADQASDEKDEQSPRLRHIPAVDPARIAAVTSVRIDIPLIRPLILETGSMGAPVDALAGCVDDLVRGWGVDVAAHAKLSRPPVPIGNPGKWVTSGDYPSAMLWKGQQANVFFRLGIGVDGRPTACHIQQSTRPVAFDEAVCKSLMLRARFSPALDADGKPIASYYLNRVRFRM